MTEDTNAYENAVAERVNGILKHEFLLETQHAYLEWMKKMVQQSIEIYNQERPHFSLLLQTAKQTHLKENIQIRTYKKQKSDNLKTA